MVSKHSLSASLESYGMLTEIGFAVAHKDFVPVLLEGTGHAVRGRSRLVGLIILWRHGRSYK